MKTMPLGLTQAQLDERKSGIWGTDAKRLGRALWREKTGRAEPQDLYDMLDPVKDWAVLRHMTREQMDVKRMMGQVLEPLNRFIFERATGRPVTEHGTARLIYTHGFPMGCHLDGLTYTSKGYPAYWEAKFVGRADEAATVRNTWQTTHNSIVCGVEWWIISYLLGNGKTEIVEQEVDPFFADDLIGRQREFWGFVVRDEEPPEEAETALVAPKPTPSLRKIDLSDESKPNWPNWAGAMLHEFGEFALTKAYADRHFVARTHIKALLPDDVGEVTRQRIVVKRKKNLDVTISLKKEEE